MSARARDDGEGLWRFAARIDVTCPRCGGGAIVRLAETAPETPPFASLASGARRLLCSGCGLDRTTTQRLGGAEALQRARDPFFGLPLRWSTRVKRTPLWALNAEHLAALEAWIGAELRERRVSRTGLRNATFRARLPRAIVAAKNRRAALVAIARLRRRAGVIAPRPAQG